MVDFFDPAARGGLNAGQAFDQAQARGVSQRQNIFELDQQRQKALFLDAREVNTRLGAGDVNGAFGVLGERLDIIEELGGDPSDTREIIDLVNSGNIQGARDLLDITDQVGVQQGFLSDPIDRQVKEARIAASKAKAELSKEGNLESQAFEDLIKDFTPKQKKAAKLVKAGLKGRAVSSAILSAIEDDKIQNLADAKAIIKQSEEFGKKTGASRARTIDQGFEKISKINAGLNNIGRAIELLNKGAGVGAIERFLPSFRAASVELDNIQKAMALDVIGAVTFGALSQGELDLAKQVALPTGLDTPALIQHLQSRKVAQEKLRGYFSDQIQFLDQGGSVASFLRQKERESATGNIQNGSQQGQQGQEFTSPSGITFTVGG